MDSEINVEDIKDKIREIIHQNFRLKPVPIVGDISTIAEYEVKHFENAIEEICSIFKHQFKEGFVYKTKGGHEFLIIKVLPEGEDEYPVKGIYLDDDWHYESSSYTLGGRAFCSTHSREDLSHSIIRKWEPKE